MASVIEWLADSALVAKFQHCLGVHNALPTTHQHKNGLRQGTYQDIVQQKKTLQWDIVSNNERGTIEKGEVQAYTIKYKSLFYLFRIASVFGEEFFYANFFAICCWNFDSFVCRRQAYFWGIFMFLGQSLKDILKIPRPRSPPVIRLEKEYVLEYGTPSTHAMSSIAFPFGLLIHTYPRYEYQFEIGFMLAVFWTALVSLSRVYLGMHSFLDVVSGFIFALLLMPLVFPMMDTFDEFFLNNPYSPIVALGLPIVCGLVYPKLEKWNTARGDTTVVLSVTSGIIFTQWLAYQHGILTRQTVPPPYELNLLPGWHALGLFLLRLVLGCTILIITRHIMKELSFRLACYVTRRNPREPEVYKHLSIELPYKYITYNTTAFMVVFTCPLLFRLIGIERPEYFTEL